MYLTRPERPKLASRSYFWKILYVLSDAAPCETTLGESSATSGSSMTRCYRPNCGSRSCFGPGLLIIDRTADFSVLLVWTLPTVSTYHYSWWSIIQFDDLLYVCVYMYMCVHVCACTSQCCCNIANATHTFTCKRKWLNVSVIISISSFSKNKVLWSTHIVLTYLAILKVYERFCHFIVWHGAKLNFKLLVRCCFARNMKRYF